MLNFVPHLIYLNEGHNFKIELIKDTDIIALFKQPPVLWLLHNNADCRLPNVDINLDFNILPFMWQTCSTTVVSERGSVAIRPFSMFSSSLKILYNMFESFHSVFQVRRLKHVV
jgi:hypothetical protein